MLAAATGLHPSAVGQLRLNLAYGLVSLIAERPESPQTFRMPRAIRAFAETSGRGEDGYRAFLERR
ncbi:MAG: hypothetical protein IPI57_07225 [Candidatus Competibacteraceae bacterium]|nr:hypothetical protein [Candidatus Competibacteraceae bacterium]